MGFPTAESNEVCIMKTRFEKEIHYIAHIIERELGAGAFHWKVAEQKRPFGLKDSLYHEGSEGSLKEALTKVEAALEIKALKNGASPNPYKVTI
jgi:hypothetical protein